MMEPLNQQAWASRLESLGLAVRERLIATRDAGHDLATAVAQEGGDTIFSIDRHVEPVIEAAIDSWPEDCKPLLLIAEGMGEDGRRTFASKSGANAKPKFRLIIDPIDGTRNIMYDKRSAWFLAAVAEDKGEATRLSDSFAAAMVELPTSKQGLADAFVATREGSATGTRRAASASQKEASPFQVVLTPSRANTLKHGFAQVANFFPGTKVLASELMEAIAAATLGADIEPGSASIFDDQYMCTGGQMIELMLGHDRFCCDLRPLFYDVLKQQGVKFRGRGLECHPYDCAGVLVAQKAGVILTDGFGRSLDAPMDVHSGVHWCGYANETLRRKIEPVILDWFKQRKVVPS